jgi:dipeptidyl aminopeptidase/acylaminoacyl peptidase
VKTGGAVSISSINYIFKAKTNRCMRSFLTVLLTVICAVNLSAQKLDKLTVEKIMRDPKWIGTSPSNASWSIDGKTIYFLWNPENATSDSMYYISLDNKVPVKATPQQKKELVTADDVTYNSARTAYIYSNRGDIYYTTLKPAVTKRISKTTERETGAQFSFNDTKVVYNSGGNLFAWDIASGETQQLTNIKVEVKQRPKDTTLQEQLLRKEQLQTFEVLRERKQKREEAEAYNKSNADKEFQTITIGEDKRVLGLNISPDGRFISYTLLKPTTNNQNTIVPSYVTESGFTTDIPGRTKVGTPRGTAEFFLYDREKDTIYSIKTDSIPGIKDVPDYLSDYPKQLAERKKKKANRNVMFSWASWSPKGNNAVVEVIAEDNKDRWLMLINKENGTLQLLDRQRDEAWVGGPGIDFTSTGWIDENTFWYQSEASGYSHLYTADVRTGTKRQLTSGNYEIQEAQLSKDKKYFYITTNEVHPGEKQFYRLSIADGKKDRITTMTGNNQVTISPDEKNIAIIYSYSNKPWELYVQENRAGGKAEQLTFKAQSEEFKSYAWREPEMVTFTARDGATVYARLYKPSNPHTNKPAVLFVHGAGYLQNAHKWWSSYFREYMFNNLLADNGYYVLDIDYRASAGYGRNWRTGIYRHMGGKDLTDNVDGVNWLVKTYGVNPKNVGLYGGSYGGFITLMGLFTQPDVFAAGAGLRSVTNWANYNHGYTSNILNEPFTDSIAYHRSSPLFFAEGLEGKLVMLHGMIDTNVHFQDIVELTQRLIELHKENWDLAVYPMEDHGFVEPSSWTDEYKRVLKLFEETLKK